MVKKIKVEIYDSSDKPYFKSMNKTDKVTGLKKQKTIKISSIVNNLKLNSEGTNHHGKINIKYMKNKTPSLHNIHWNTIFNVSDDVAAENGDAFTASEDKIVTALNKEQDKYHFVGTKDKNVSLKVDDLASNTVNVDNLAAVVKHIYSDQAGQDMKLLSLSYDKDTRYLEATYKRKSILGDTQEYDSLSYDNCDIKNNKLITYSSLTNKPVNFEDSNLSASPGYLDIKSDAEATKPTGTGDIIDFQL